MLLCEPPEMEEPSASDSGGVVSPPEADVHVLDRKRPPPLMMWLVGAEGRENTGVGWSMKEKAGEIKVISH